MGYQLWLTSWQGGNGADGYDLTISIAEIVTGENVSEQMGLEVIVGGGSETIVEGLPRESRLNFRSLFQRVLIAGNRRGLFPRVILDSFCRSFLQDTFKSTQSVQRAGETGVSIQL